MELRDIFPFDYVGGGYFRKKKVPKGKTATILHGEQAVKYIYEKMKLENKKNNRG